MNAFRKWPGYLWAFLNGVLLTFAVIFFVQSKFIASQIQYIVHSVMTADMSVEQKALALLGEAHAIVRFGARHVDETLPQVFQRLPVRSFDEAVILPVTGCGDAAGILYRLLDEAGIPPRIAQMRCGTLDGCHIVVEGKIGGRWVVFDPLFGFAFRNGNNQLATFREVSADWPRFRQQVPAGYPAAFAYDGVRYTNWEKIPVLMPFLQQVLVAAVGEERTRDISLRSYAMVPNRLYFFLCLAGLVLVNGVGLALWRLRPAAGLAESAELPGEAEASLPY